MFSGFSYSLNIIDNHNNKGKRTTKEKKNYATIWNNPLFILQDICKFINEKVDRNSIESIYYATCISKVLGNCPVSRFPCLNMELL